MCSIIGSFSKKKITELAELNRYRGEHSHSLFVICPMSYKVLFQHKGLGSLKFNEHEIPEGYIVAHQQAPTSENRDDTIHPAAWRGEGKYDDLLWHNGIIKSHCVKRLQELHKTEETWDTKLLLWNLVKLEDPLNNVDGTFACLWKNKEHMYLFRNEISPMFIDDNFNISSTKFENATPIAANVIFHFDVHYKILAEYMQFKTVTNPYYGVL